MTQYTWDEAMAWWKSQDNGNYEDGMNFYTMIRNAAERLLAQSMIDMGCEDQGIGTSDVNHEVYHMYGSYLNYENCCKEHNEEPNMITFLMDVTADISL